MRQRWSFPAALQLCTTLLFAKNIVPDTKTTGTETGGTFLTRPKQLPDRMHPIP